MIKLLIFSIAADSLSGLPSAVAEGPLSDRRAQLGMDAGDDGIARARESAMAFLRRRRELFAGRDFAASAAAGLLVLQVARLPEAVEALDLAELDGDAGSKLTDSQRLALAEIWPHARRRGGTRLLTPRPRSVESPMLLSA